MNQTAPTIPPSLAQRLRAAHRIAVLTGAGVSAESGVPTFRDAQTGLWANFRAEELATPEAFARQPKLVWEWYAWRRTLVAQASPNAAHRALARLEQLAPHLTLVTQNVDGLHQRAGSRRVLELHGNLTRVKCSADGRRVAGWPETGEVPPRCLHCGAALRPDVVWFGEDLPEAALTEAWDASKACDVFLSIGTSSLVQPAAGLPGLARHHGACVVEVNPAETPLTCTADHVLRGPAGVCLPALLAAAWPES